MSRRGSSYYIEASIDNAASIPNGLWSTVTDAHLTISCSQTCLLDPPFFSSCGPTTLRRTQPEAEPLQRAGRRPDPHVRADAPALAQQRLFHEPLTQGLPPRQWRWTCARALPWTGRRATERAGQLWRGADGRGRCDGGWCAGAARAGDPGRVPVQRERERERERDGSARSGCDVGRAGRAKPTLGIAACAGRRGEEAHAERAGHQGHLVWVSHQHFPHSRCVSAL